MTKFKLKIASRRSKLAMVQTLWVKEQLEKNIPGLRVSIEAMATQGIRSVVMIYTIANYIRAIRAIKVWINYQIALL